jgi:enoyl-CoA hydratase
MNSMAFDVMVPLKEALEKVTYDNDVRVVVLTGAGRGFSSGADHKSAGSVPNVDGLTRPAYALRSMELLDDVILALRRLHQPVIAAVNGPAIGGGLCLALACDIRYAAAGARLGVPFVRLGMHAGMAGTYLLPNVVGEAAARDLLLTGRVVDADEALRLGLVSRVVEPAAFLGDVLDTAAQVAATAPIASRLTKLALRDGGHADFESCLQWEAMAQPITLATADLQEGIRASREKRTPVFTGR